MISSNIRAVVARSTQLLRIHHRRCGLSVALAALSLGWLAFSACRQGAKDPLSGVWRAVVLNKAGDEVAFQLDLKRAGGQVIGALVNGDERLASTSGSFDGKTLKLRYDFYDGDLTATLADGTLHGAFERQRHKEILRRELRAWRETNEARPVATNSADLSGDWVLRVVRIGGDQARIWRASLHQNGTALSGTIIPLSGDWGTMTGTFENGQLTLSRFDGINAHLFKAKLNPRGQLEGQLDSQDKVVAERDDKTRGDALPAPPNPLAYTKLKNPNEPFRFSFPDLDHRIISSTDARFQNKVVIVTITGSWCPNCHDEAVVLNDLYARYHARGLEVIGLAFEYTGQAERDREQVKIFARRHQIPYPMLLAGTTEEGDLEKKLPQLVNFGAFPTTIFIGRDGLVKKIHAGFEGPATGARFTRLKAELEEIVKELLDGTAS
jgi:peroxiredoxin